MHPTPSLPLFLAAAVRRAAAAVAAAAAADGATAPGCITVDVASAPDGGVLMTIADSGVALSDAPPPPKSRRRRRRACDEADAEADALASATAAAASLLAPAAAAALDPRALTIATAAASESAWRTYGARCVAGGAERAVAVHAAPPLAKAPADGGGTRVAARAAPDVTAAAAAAAAAAALDAVAPALPPGTRLAVTGGAGGPQPPPPLPLDFATAVCVWASPPAAAPAALTIATGTVSSDAAGRRSGNGPAGYRAHAALAAGATRFAVPAAADAPPSATLVVTVDGGAVTALPPLSALRAAPWARYGLGVSAVHPAATPGVGRVTFTPASVLAGSVPSLIVLAFSAAPASLTAAASAGAALTPTAAAARRLAAAALAAALADLKRSVPPDHLLPTGERALLGALPLVATALAGVAARAAVDSAVATAVAGLVQAVGGAATPHDALLAALVDAVDAERAAGGGEEEEDDHAARRRAPRPLVVEEVASDGGDDGGGMWAPLASQVEW